MMPNKGILKQKVSKQGVTADFWFIKQVTVVYYPDGGADVNVLKELYKSEADFDAGAEALERSNFVVHEAVANSIVQTNFFNRIKTDDPELSDGVEV